MLTVSFVSPRITCWKCMWVPVRQCLNMTTGRLGKNPLHNQITPPQKIKATKNTSTYPFQAKETTSIKEVTAPEHYYPFSPVGFERSTDLMISWHPPSVCMQWAMASQSSRSLPLDYALYQVEDNRNEPDSDIKCKVTNH